jgi:hypothetical protein
MTIDIKTSSANINKLIRTVKTTGDKYNKTVQEAIVAIVVHANAFGDCTGAARLVAAMPRSNRRQLVVDHFSDYSPINVVKDGDNTFKASLRKPFLDKDETNPNKHYNAFNIDGVRANNWFERPEAAKIPDVVTYDSIRANVLKMLESNLKKADDCDNDDDKTLTKAFIKHIRSAASGFAVANPVDNLKGTEWDTSGDEPATGTNVETIKANSATAKKAAERKAA